MIGRRLFLAAALSFAACRSAETPRNERPDPLEALPHDGLVPETLRIGVTPSSGSRTAEYFEPLASYLTKKGLRTQMVAAGDYDNLAELVVAGQVEVAVMSPLAYVKARGSLPAVPIATASQSGSPTYLGYLVARPLAGGEAPPIESLRGKRIAWVNRSSTSGYLYPRAMLEMRGIAADSFFAAPPVFAGDHESAIQALLDDQVDVAATASSFVDPGTRNQVDGAEALAVVAKTSRIPLDCVVVSDKVARDYARTLRRALLELVDDGPASTALAQSWGINGFLEADERRYDEIARVYAAAIP